MALVPGRRLDADHQRAHRRQPGDGVLADAVVGAAAAAARVVDEDHGGAVAPVAEPGERLPRIRRPLRTPRVEPLDELQHQLALARLGQAEDRDVLQLGDVPLDAVQDDELRVLRHRLPVGAIRAPATDAVGRVLFRHRVAVVGDRQELAAVVRGLVEEPADRSGRVAAGSGVGVQAPRSRTAVVSHGIRRTATREAVAGAISSAAATAAPAALRSSAAASCSRPPRSRVGGYRDRDRYPIMGAGRG